jgi:hypothetical protein
MLMNRSPKTRRLLAALGFLSLIALVAPVASSKDKIRGEWTVIITAPDSATGNHFGARTFKLSIGKYPSESFSGPFKLLSATSATGVMAQGVWRNFGRTYSLTFELACEEGEACGSVTLRGRMRSETEMNGVAVVVWDTQDRSNPTGFETVNGTFQGVRQ